MLNKESSPNDLWLSDAHHRAKHAVTRFPRQRCRRPTPRSCAAGANGTNMCLWWSARSNAPHQQLELVEGISPRGLTYLCTEKAGYINSAPLYICRVVLFLLRQRRGAGLVF